MTANASPAELTRGPTPISFVITDLDVGGAEGALVRLVLGLDPDRWRRSVINLSGPGVLVEPLIKEGIPTLSLNVPRGRPVKARSMLRTALIAQAPQIVQSYLFHANVLTRMAAIGLRPRPRIVGGIRVAERERRWHLLLERATSRWGDGSVCVSTGVYRHGVEHRLDRPERLMVIPNGIDPEPFDTAEPVSTDDLPAPIGSDDVIVLFVGRLDRQKGLPDLLDACARLVGREDLRRPWRLLIVGDGPLMEPIRARIEGTPTLRARVHLLGRRSDVASLLKRADLLVLPSHWEGMPNVVLEAMACSRAVVATRVEGSEDLVEPGRTGWLIEPRRPIALAEALVEALADPERTISMGRAGRQRLEDRFTHRAVIEAYERLWLARLDASSDP